MTLAKKTYDNKDTKLVLIVLGSFVLLCVILFSTIYHYSAQRVSQLQDVNYIVHTKDGKKYRVYGYSSPDETTSYYSFTDETGTVVYVPLSNWDYAESIKEVINHGNK